MELTYQTECHQSLKITPQIWNAIEHQKAFWTEMDEQSQIIQEILIQI